MENTELTTVISAAEMVAAQVRDFQVKSEQDLLDAVSFLGKIASAKKAVEERRTAMVKPLNDQVKDINASFKPVMDLLNQTDTLIRGKVTDWKRAEQARIAEQERLNREAAEAIMKLPIEGPGVATNEEIQAIISPEVPIQRVHTNGGSAQFRKVWKFEIVNASEVPPWYFTLDEKKIRAAIAAGEREIRGIRIYEEEQLAVSGA